MTDKLRCEIVKDLLPGYVEGLTSNVTNEAVKEHLQNCAKCTEAYERMKEPDEVVETNYDLEKEVDYLKGIQKHSRKKMFAFGLGITVFLFIVLSLVTRYGLNRTVSFDEIDCQWDITKSEDGTHYFEIQGELQDDHYGVTTISFGGNEDKMELTIEAVPRILFNYRMNKEILFRTELNRIPKEIEIGGRTVYKDGMKISKQTSEIYATKHLYIGSAPDNGKTIEMLNMNNTLGNGTMELFTDQEPYGCRLYLDRVITEDMVTAKEKAMEAYSAVMIAMTGNLEYVEWKYNVGDEVRIKVVTAQDVKKLTGSDVKLAYDNVAILQEVMSCTAFEGVFDLGNDKEILQK